MSQVVLQLVLALEYFKCQFQILSEWSSQLFDAIDKTHDFVLFVFRPFFDPRSSVENVSNHVDTLVSYFDG